MCRVTCKNYSYIRHIMPAGFILLKSHFPGVIYNRNVSCVFTTKGKIQRSICSLGDKTRTKWRRIISDEQDEVRAAVVGIPLPQYISI
jgi:hypothetical protein